MLLLLSNEAKEDFNYENQQYLHHKQALWTFLLTHIDSDVDYLIKLLSIIPNPWISTQISCGLSSDNPSHNMNRLILQKLKLKFNWQIYKQSACDLQGNVTSTIPLYLFRFQKRFRQFPRTSKSFYWSRVSWTLLAGINSRRSSTYTMALLLLNLPVNLKAKSLQSDKNQVSLNEDIVVSNVVTVLSSVCHESQVKSLIRLPKLLRHLLSYRIVDHKFFFSKVIALIKKSTTVLSRANRQPKQKDTKKN